MPLYKIIHNEDEAYILADDISTALKDWATAEAARTDDDPNVLEPQSITYLADDDQIVVHNSKGIPSFIGDMEAIENEEETPS